MATPQKHGAYVRRAKKHAADEADILAEAAKNNGVPPLPFGMPIFGMRRAGEKIVVAESARRRMPMLACVANFGEDCVGKERADGAEGAGETPAAAPEREDPQINAWVARRIRRGVAEQRTVYVYAVNPDAPKHERRTRHKVTEWLPDAMRKTVFAFNTFRYALAGYGFAEEAALKKLRAILSPMEYEAYTLTGIVGFHSEKSGIAYVIRKGKPTLACKGWRVLAALCGHAAGYFPQSFAGVMPPTDEVIAHLLMLRHSEHFFWKKCNQHPADAPEAGL